MNLLCEILELAPAGFEPALPKETELKSVALDHSAIAPLFVIETHLVFIIKIEEKDCCLCF